MQARDEVNHKAHRVNYILKSDWYKVLKFFTNKTFSEID